MRKSSKKAQKWAVSQSSKVRPLTFNMNIYANWSRIEIWIYLQFRVHYFSSSLQRSYVFMIMRCHIFTDEKWHSSRSSQHEVTALLLVHCFWWRPDVVSTCTCSVCGLLSEGHLRAASSSTTWTLVSLTARWRGAVDLHHLLLASEGVFTSTFVSNHLDVFMWNK